MDRCVDDFIGLAQGLQTLCCNTRRYIMHAIDLVLAKPDKETQHRKEAVSEKKMNKGNGGRNQYKEISHWILNTHKGTMQLTNRKWE